MKVIEVTAQREYKNPVTGGRSIKLDIYTEDSDGKVYDIEVQNDVARADIRRARFHSSMLDTKMLKEKQKFKEIHDSYVIFITKNDYMKMGLAMYHVERIVQETRTLFDVVKNLMEAMKMSAEQAMTVLKISDADKAVLAKWMYKEASKC